MQAGNSLDASAEIGGMVKVMLPLDDAPPRLGEEIEVWLIASELPCYNVMLTMSGGAEPSPSQQEMVHWLLALLPLCPA
jgi:hypothetical protein